MGECARESGTSNQSEQDRGERKGGCMNESVCESDANGTGMESDTYMPVTVRSTLFL
jgi:hypothetical protein